MERSVTKKARTQGWFALVFSGACAAWALEAGAGEIMDNTKLISLLENHISLAVIKPKLMNSDCQLNSDTSELIKFQIAAEKGGMDKKDIDELLQIIIKESTRVSTKMREWVSRFMNGCVNFKPEEYDSMVRTLQREGKAIVPFLLEKIEEEDEKKRAGILDLLGKLGDRSEKVLQVVRQMLEDRAPGVRAQAAKAFADLGTPEGAKELIESLKQRKEFIDGIALALGYLKNPIATEALTKILDESPNMDGRIAAAYALGLLRTKEEKAILALLKKGIQDDRNSTLRWKSAEALGAIGDPRTVEYVKRVYQRYQDGRAELLLSLRQASFKQFDTVDFLIPCTNEDKQDVRVAANLTLKFLTGENYNNFDEWSSWWEINKSRPDWIRPPDLAQPKK